MAHHDILDGQQLLHHRSEYGMNASKTDSSVHELDRKLATSVEDQIMESQFSVKFMNSAIEIRRVCQFYIPF